MNQQEYQELARKVRNEPHKVTDKVLAQLRRSAWTGPGLLHQIVALQGSRGLLYVRTGKHSRVDFPSYSNGAGYLPEKTKRINDYKKGRVSKGRSFTKLED